MSPFRRPRGKTAAALALALSALLTHAPARAYWPLHAKKAQVVYATPGPVVYTGQAPTTYVMTTGSAPVVYTGQAPATYTGQAPVTYAGQAPVSYTGQAPTTYVTTTGSAPAAATTATGAAPTVGNAPSTEGVRISEPVRRVIYADLVRYYHSEDSGTTSIEKLRALRQQARDGYQAALGEDDADLNPAEEADLNTLVDWVLTGGAGSAGRTYYPPLPPPNGVAGAPGTGYGAPTVYGTPAVYYAAPPVLLVPLAVQPVHKHHLFHK